MAGSCSQTPKTGVTEGSCRSLSELWGVSTGQRFWVPVPPRGYQCGLLGAPHWKGQWRPLVLPRGTGAPQRGLKQSFGPGKKWLFLEKPVAGRKLTRVCRVEKMVLIFILTWL